MFSVQFISFRPINYGVPGSPRFQVELSPVAPVGKLTPGKSGRREKERGGGNSERKAKTNYVESDHVTSEGIKEKCWFSAF